MLIIYLDFKSAASYLALGPTIALIEETGVKANWLTFSSRPFTIPVEQSEETVGERHRRVRAIARRDTHLHYAAMQNLDMSFADQPKGSETALAALAALDCDPVPFIRSAFSAYWKEQKDLDDQLVIEQILKQCGLDQPDWSDAFSKLNDIRQQAEDQKIFETPSFLIDGQLFLGREHLPWVRSIITGKE